MTSHDPRAEHATQAQDSARTQDGAPPGTEPGPSTGGTVTVHPHGELTSYFGRVTKVQVPIAPGMTVAALLEQLGVPAKEVWVVALNGETVKPEATLSGGDSLELFSPVAGG